MSKKLPNPPVYYVVAQAQFNPVAAMTNYINEIQNALRLEGYTSFESQKVTQLHFKRSSSEASSKAEVVELPVWRITHSNEKSGFILSQTHLSYHTTHYETHDLFFNSFLMGLEKVHSVAKLDHLSRLGLRYLNAVLPLTDEATSLYLNTGLHGVQTEANLRYSLQELVFDTKLKHCSSSGTLVNRILCSRGPLGYPPDIAPHNLLPKLKFHKKKPFLHAIIDIDHFVQEKMSFDFKQIKTQLSSLHAEIKKVFRADITEHAEKVWSHE